MSQTHVPCDPSSLLSHRLVLLSGSGLLGPVASELDLVVSLDRLLGSADGGSTLDGSGAEVTTVAVLGGLVGNSKVGPVSGSNLVSICSFARTLLPRRVNSKYLPKLTFGWPW